MPTKLPLSLVLLAACGPAAHSPSLHLLSKSADIVAGTTDSADPAVVEIDFGNATCTGTLIGPQTVLTAGHCTDDAEINPSGQKLCVSNCGQRDFQIAVLFGADDQTAYKQNKYIVVDAYEHHPLLNLNGRGNQIANDIGLMHLASTVMASGDPEPAPLEINRTPAEQLDLSSIRFVGYGITSGRGQDSGIKRQVTKHNVQIANADELYFSVDPTDKGNTCSGDSGGPAFVTISGKEYVLGVTSRGDGSCQQEGIDTRVDASLDFITQFATKRGDTLVGGNGTGGSVPGTSGGTTGGATTGGGTGGTTGGGGSGASCKACTSDATCGAGGHCVAETASATSGYCSPPCGANGACASGDQCYYLDQAKTISGCYPASGSCASGGGGTAVASCSDCQADADCGSGRCVSEPTGGYCAAACSTDSDCGAGFGCVVVDRANAVKGCRPTIADCGSRPSGNGGTTGATGGTTGSSSTGGTTSGTTDGTGAGSGGEVGATTTGGGTGRGSPGCSSTGGDFAWMLLGLVPVLRRRRRAC